MPVTLSPKQKAAWANSTHFINIWTGSVSAGKTFTWVLAMLHKIQNAPPEGDIVIMGYSLPSIHRNVFSLIESHPLFAPFQEHVRYNHNSDKAIMFGRTVHIIGAGTVKASDRIRGMTIRYAFVDEGTLMPHEVFTMLLTRLRVPGAQCFITTNPGSRNHYLMEDYILRPEETDTYAVTFTMDDNPGLPPEYLARQKELYRGLFYQRFILGRWVAAEGAVYQTWDPDTMVQPLPDPATLTLLATGIDYGVTNPSAGAALAISTDGTLHIVGEWNPNPGRDQRLTDVQLAESYIAWENQLADVYGPPQRRYADPSAASFIEEMRLRRYPFFKADNEVVEGINTVASLLDTGRLFLAPDTPALQTELSEYRWDPKATEKGLDKPIKQNDHHADALRYAVFSSRLMWQRRLRPAQLTAPNPLAP